MQMALRLWAAIPVTMIQRRSVAVADLGMRDPILPLRAESINAGDVVQFIDDCIDLFGIYFLRSQDVGVIDRNGPAVGVLPLGQGVDEVNDLPAAEMAMILEDLVEQFVFGFREQFIIGIDGKSYFVIAKRGDVLRPIAGILRGRAFIDSVQNMAENGSLVL